MTGTRRLVHAITLGALLLLWLAGQRPARCQEQEPEAATLPKVEPVAQEPTEELPAPTEAYPEVLLPAESSTAPGGPSPGFDYLVGAEDVLDVEVFGVPELSKTVRVANDGTISLPLLGHVQVAGLTTQQLRQELEKRWGESYLENPQVSVFVKEFRAQPVSIIGAEVQSTSRAVQKRTVEC